MPVLQCVPSKTVWPWTYSTQCNGKKLNIHLPSKYSFNLQMGSSNSISSFFPLDSQDLKLDRRLIPSGWSRNRMLAVCQLTHIYLNNMALIVLEDSWRKLDLTPQNNEKSLLSLFWLHRASPPAWRKAVWLRDWLMSPRNTEFNTECRAFSWCALL